MMVDTGLVAMSAQMLRRIMRRMIGVIGAMQPPLMVMIGDKIPRIRDDLLPARRFHELRLALMH